MPDDVAREACPVASDTWPVLVVDVAADAKVSVWWTNVADGEAMPEVVEHSSLIGLDGVRARVRVAVNCACSP